MDPLSITVSITTLLLGCAKVAKTAHDARSRYKGSSLTMSSIASECSAVTAALSTLQNVVTCEAGFLDETALSSLECVITGCTLTLSVLEEYVVELHFVQDPTAFKIRPLTAKEKTTVVWNESEMGELLQQLQGHKASITLLLTIAQSQTQSRTHDLLEANNAKLENVMHRAMTSRRKKTPSSIRHSSLAFPETRSMVIDDSESTVSATTFDFDDVIVNARIYRHTMRKHQMTMKPQLHDATLQQPAQQLEKGLPTSLFEGLQLQSSDHAPAAAEKPSQNDSPTQRNADESNSTYSSISIGTVRLLDRDNEQLEIQSSDRSRIPIVSRLTNRVDENLRRTYVRGVPTVEVQEAAVVPRVGLSFLPGADKPQINHMELTDIAGNAPDQKDAIWRVNTAGSLLLDHDVAQDLSIIETDQTLTIVRKGMDRKQQENGLNGTRTKIPKDVADDAVTIDSKRVTLVADLRTAQWDLEGLLIEVDGNSLSDLMIKFRKIISIGEPSMSFQKTKMVLEQVIDGVRRLYLRSPILSRMPTRARISSSKITRYGVDHSQMFRTLITSKGIREIIMLSASHYNSLDPTGSSDVTQSFIRPKFLQMMILLLSLVNNEDLAEMKDFLESTYGLKSDRRSLELTFLKIIPLISINPREFLKFLITTIEGWPLPDKNDSLHDQRWDIFIMRILADGYLLPGTVTDLGRPQQSWIAKWPEEGIKSNSIFRHLQFSGRLRVINEIPPMQLHPSEGLKEVTVVMTDDSKYIVASDDLEKITCLIPGIYQVHETAADKRQFDLAIREDTVNSELSEGIRHLNNDIQKFNTLRANQKRSANFSGLLTKRGSANMVFLNELQGTGRLARQTAVLCGNVLAAAYKIEGRPISRSEATRSMVRDIKLVNSVVSMIEDKWGAVDSKMFLDSKIFLDSWTFFNKQSLEGIRSQILLAEKRRETLVQEKDLSENPVAKILYPEGGNEISAVSWNDYRAWTSEHNGNLNVEAKQVTVKEVKWLNDEIVELSLYQQAAKLFVTPLEPVPEGYRDDEVRAGDSGMLVGQYLAIGEADSEDPTPNAPLIMTNYLRITGQEEENKGRRGKNRGQNVETRTIQCFK